MPVIIDCWADNARLVYDNETRTTSNSPGVVTRVPGFGDSEPVEWIDPSHASAGSYFKDIANALVALGYQRNKTIRGAPYDFRKAPSKCVTDYLYAKLTPLVVVYWSTLSVNNWPCYCGESPWGHVYRV